MKFFLALLFVLTSINSFADDKIELLSCVDCFNFVAPSILGSESISPAEVGLISYDSDADAFRGYNNNGDWVSISNNFVFRSVTAAATLDITDAEDQIKLDSTTAAFTLTLPTAVGNLGKVYRLKKTDTSTNVITVDANGSETIDGLTTRKLTRFGDYINIASDGANWETTSSHETVYASYEIDTAQTAGNGTDLVIDYGTGIEDTHSAVTTGSSWKFTAPIAGLYQVTGAFRSDTAPKRIALHKNGTRISFLAELSAASQTAGFSSTIRLVAGDYIDFRNGNSGAATITGNGLYNHVQISRTGH